MAPTSGTNGDGYEIGAVLLNGELREQSPSYIVRVIRIDLNQPYARSQVAVPMQLEVHYENRALHCLESRRGPLLRRTRGPSTAAKTIETVR